MRPNSNSASDTLSEISEASTTGTERGSCYSSDYRDELQELAVSLGLVSSDDLHRDRFRVDRKKLENMLLGNAECAKSAHEFFQKIMKETKTLILWPSRLKIGAKSKKDPHIKIAGLMGDVNNAKQKVMAVLDTRSNRVTMKLDVSYTDHSHIIGKGGLRIKRVMEETSCHIHFPDSNRNNQEEKSNQVSIAGEMANIEKARARVRELTPLIFCFELPNVGTMQGFPEHTSPFVVSVQEAYNVQVMFRTRAKLHSTLVMVKGCEWEVHRVKEATLQLITHMCGNFAKQVQAQVQMMMEISPQYHTLVLGVNHQNLKNIMQRTGVQVMFPDPSDPYTPSLKKSNVTITGLIHNVYSARQMILGSLPLVLMFDLMPEVVSLNPATLDDIMQALDVYISIRHKPKQNIYSVVIKGLERNANNIYEARRRLTGSNDIAIKADIPKTYYARGSVPSFLKSFTAVGSYFHGSFSNARMINNDPDFLPAPLTFSSFLPPALANAFNTPTNSPRPSRDHTPETSFGTPPDTGTAIKITQNKLLSAEALSSIRLQPSYSFSLPDVRGDNMAYSSLSSGTSSLSSPNASPRTTSPSQSFIENTSDNMQERKAPGFERSVGNITMDLHQQLRIQAAQAMQGMPSRTEVRIPTPTWSGYGFSQSSPSNMLQNKKKEEIMNTDEDTPKARNLFSDSIDSSTNNFSASNYLDAAASTTFNVVTSSNYSDLPSQLASLGLQKYIQLFKSHEIDLTTFQTLTEADLREIGVTALGARRKMMLFISELKKREHLNVFRGSAAPGAERKSSSSTSSPNNDSW